MKKHSITAEEFDRKFESSEEIITHLEIAKADRPGQKQQRVNVDFPIWMIESLDKEAQKLGITRQSIIKVWIAEKLKKAAI